MKNGDIQMMIITTAGDESDVRDGRELRRAALAQKVPIITTIAAARATGARRRMGSMLGGGVVWYVCVVWCGVVWCGLLLGGTCRC